jgi:L-alanine-DL-glutamate epimerase-like enolase superfamily enzyme
MKECITDYELWKLEVPTGRVIGDCTCRYNALDVLAVCLKTSQGRCGWGFGDTVSAGVFAKPAPWIRPMPSLADIRQDFEQDFWPLLEGMTPFGLKMRRPKLFSGYSYSCLGVRIALWDLMAKVVEMPLYQFLGASPKQNRVRAYASGLDFPLSEEDAVALFRSFVHRGFNAVKVKVGHPDVERDLQRLRVVRECVGDAVDIAIDANEAWNCDEAVGRIQFLQQHGVRLAYVEDPLPRTDIEGLARLNATVDVDVVGHDYIVDPKELRRFAEHKAFSRLRVMGDFDYALACVDISADCGTPVIFGNSIFELSVHAAVALPQVDRIEFSDLAWNLLPQTPIRFEKGYAVAPDRPGLGLDPNPEMLHRFSKPAAATPVAPGSFSASD